MRCATMLAKLRQDSNKMARRVAGERRVGVGEELQVMTEAYNARSLNSKNPDPPLAALLGNGALRRFLNVASRPSTLERAQHLQAAIFARPDHHAFG
jgi:hypothetical protein